MSNETTLQTVTAELPVPNGFRAEWRTPKTGERFWCTNCWTTNNFDWNDTQKAFVLVPIFTPPQWLVESGYQKLFWDGKEWCLRGQPGDLWQRATMHSDLMEMLKGIDPKQTPVAWERVK